MKIPRQYQEVAIQAALDSMQVKKSTLLVCPVGSGKSLIHAEIIKRIHDKWPRTKIVSVTHTKELLVQNADTLREQYPTADYGFFCAGLGQKKLQNEITFASIQSIHSKATEFARCPEIVMIDEVHLTSHNEDTQYRRFLKSIWELNPNARLLGLTATPYRSDSGRLDEGDGALFDGIAYEIGIRWMIENGYLCRPVTPSVSTKMDVSGVGTRNGDYIAAQLEAAVDIDEVTKSCVMEMVDKAIDRKKWLIFTAGMEHCLHVRDALRLAGISAEMVTAETENRDQIIKDYKGGKFQALVNIAVLTTGFNCPEIDMIAFMRPTKSNVLYVQTSGRGLRTAPNKESCLFLDFGGVIDRLGPIDEVNVTKKNRKQIAEEMREAILKKCPSCGAECPAAQRYCYGCSYCFFEIELTAKADDKNSMLSEIIIQEHEVIGVTKKFHRKNPDKPPTLQVTYATMAGAFKEWVCFQHPPGYARDKARHWHLLRSHEAVPETIDDALNIDYHAPTKIKVKKDGKYWSIIGVDFTPIVREQTEIEEIPF